jgi:hypothetical protein
MHLVTYNAGDTNAAWFGNRLKSSRNVDAIARDVVAVDDDIPEVDPDADFNPVGRG